MKSGSGPENRACPVNLAFLCLVSEISNTFCKTSATQSRPRKFSFLVLSVVNYPDGYRQSFLESTVFHRASPRPIFYPYYRQFQISCDSLLLHVELILYERVSCYMRYGRSPRPIFDSFIKSRLCSPSARLLIDVTTQFSVTVLCFVTNL